MMLSQRETIALACQFLPITGVSLIAVNFLFVFRNTVQGMGKPLMPLLSGIAEMILRIAVIVLFMGRIGFAAAGWAEAAAWTGGFAVNIAAYFIVIRQKLTKQHGIRTA